MIGMLNNVLRGAFLLAATVLALAGCGLVHKDVPVTADFTIGGFPPTPATLQATQITTPLAAGAGDLSALSSVVLNQAVLKSTDGQDLSFITGGTITISATGQSTITLATLAAPGIVGSASYTIVAQPDLRPYLENNGTIMVSINYSTPPVPARGLELDLNIHATL